MDQQLKRRMEIERLVVAHLVDTMREHGWNVDHVFDGEEECRECATTEQVFEHVFAVDACSIFFKNADGQINFALIVLGNDGHDAIADYSYGRDDFQEIVEKYVDPYCDSLID